MKAPQKALDFNVMQFLDGKYDTYRNPGLNLSTKLGLKYDSIIIFDSE